MIFLWLYLCHLKTLIHSNDAAPIFTLEIYTNLKYGTAMPVSITYF